MLIPLLFLSLGAAAPEQVRSLPTTPPCADTVPSARVRVLGLLRVAQSADVPVLQPLRAVDTSHLRLLSEPSEAATCRALREKVLPQLGTDRLTGRPWRVAVMEADGFYFVIASRDRRPASETDRRVVMGENGPPTLYVFDHQLGLITATRA